MKKTKNIIEEYYSKNFENGSWKGLEEYAQRIKKMYLKEIIFQKEIYKNKNEKEIAISSLKIVNKAYIQSINRFQKLLNKLPETL